MSNQSEQGGHISLNNVIENSEDGADTHNLDNSEEEQDLKYVFMTKKRKAAAAESEKPTPAKRPKIDNEKDS